MSRSSILLTGRQRVMSEQVTQTQLIGGSNSDVPVEVQAYNSIPVGAQPYPLATYAQTSGGSVEMAVNGSGTPVNFEIAPGSNVIWRIDRLTLVIVSNTSPSPTGFGDLAALSTGLALTVRDGVAGADLIYDLTGGQALKAGNDLAAIGDVGTNGNSITFDYDLKAPIRLEGADDELIRCTVSDDLSGLARLRLAAIGVIESSLT